MGASQVSFFSFFFFSRLAILIDPSSNKLKKLEVPQNKSFYMKM